MPSPRTVASASVRTRLLVGGIAVVVIATVVIGAFLLRPGPLSGDVAWSAEASELGLPLPETVDVSRDTGDLIAIGNAVIDDRGRPVHVGLPATAYALRADGSGWGPVLGTSIDDLQLAGWDSEGNTTFEFVASTDLAPLLATVGGASPEDVSELRLQAIGEDLVVLGSCWTDDPSLSRINGDTSITFALDTRTGELRWHVVLEEDSCTNFGSGYQRAEVLVDPIVRDEEPPVVRDLDTGETLWEVTNNKRVYVIGDGLYQRAPDGLHRLDPRTGELLWSTQDCESPGEPDAVGDDPGLLTLRCDRQPVVIDATTGAHRDLPDSDRRQEHEQDWTHPANAELGSVLVERDGAVVTASDPLTGAELWRTELELADGDVVQIRSYGGPRATVAIRISSGAADDRVVVFDSFSGDELVESRDDGEWQLRNGRDGAALLVYTEVPHTDAEDAQLFSVPGHGR